MVLATFGTYGDLHPFIAVALRLRELGCEPVIATSSVYRDKVESEGIEFRRLRPEQEDVERDLGLTRQQLLRKVARRPQFVLRGVLLPYLQQSYEDSLLVLGDADLVVTHTTALATKVAAEKMRLPHLGVVLQPMALLSAHDPPEFAPAPALMRWIYRCGPWFRGIFVALVKSFSRSWAAPIDALRREVGLPVSARHPFFEGQFTAEGALALYSPVFGGPQPDHPGLTSIAGFAFYDADEAGATQLEPALIDFIAAGEAPVVFTLGTSAVHDSAAFIEASLQAVDVLKCRAVFVLDVEQRNRWQARNNDQLMFCSYAPYSLLFPQASVIVHHGGVGTTAQALRSGRPQLITPYLVDQPDNAARVERLRVGRTLSLKRYSATRVASVLGALLADAPMARRAREVGARVAAEDGAGEAARIIVSVLRSSQRARHHQRDP